MILSPGKDDVFNIMERVQEGGGHVGEKARCNSGSIKACVLYYDSYV